MKPQDRAEISTPVASRSGEFGATATAAAPCAYVTITYACVSSSSDARANAVALNARRAAHSSGEAMKRSSLTSATAIVCTMAVLAPLGDAARKLKSAVVVDVVAVVAGVPAADVAAVAEEMVDELPSAGAGSVSVLVPGVETAAVAPALVAATRGVDPTGTGVVAVVDAELFVGSLVVLVVVVAVVVVVGAVAVVIVVVVVVVVVAVGMVVAVAVMLIGVTSVPDAAADVVLLGVGATATVCASGVAATPVEAEVPGAVELVNVRAYSVQPVACRTPEAPTSVWSRHNWPRALYENAKHSFDLLQRPAQIWARAAGRMSPRTPRPLR